MSSGWIRECATPRLHQAGCAACDRAIFVSGNGRGGTTILGKLIHSLEGVEYAFEPPMLFSILPLIGQMPDAQFRLLYETYVYEDLLMGQVTGRSFNLNRNDDSCIYVSKAAAEVARRLETTWTKARAAAAADRARPAIKIPDMTPVLPRLKQLYPSMAVVVIHRHPNPVIESVLKKRWFSDESLQRMDLIWPSLTPDFTTPFWVAREDIMAWRAWSELERAAYYCTRIAVPVPGAINLTYEALIADPHSVVRALATELHLDFGPNTPIIIADTKARSEPSENWLDKLPARIQEELLRAYAG